MKLSGYFKQVEHGNSIPSRINLKSWKYNKNALKTLSNIGKGNVSISSIYMKSINEKTSNEKFMQMHEVSGDIFLRIILIRIS